VRLTNQNTEWMSAFGLNVGKLNIRVLWEFVHRSIRYKLRNRSECAKCVLVENPYEPNLVLWRPGYPLALGHLLKIKVHTNTHKLTNIRSQWKSAYILDPFRRIWIFTRTSILYILFILSLGFYFCVRILYVLLESLQQQLQQIKYFSLIVIVKYESWNIRYVR